MGNDLINILKLNKTQYLHQFEEIFIRNVYIYPMFTNMELNYSKTKHFYQGEFFCWLIKKFNFKKDVLAIFLNPWHKLIVNKMIQNIVYVFGYGCIVFSIWHFDMICATPKVFDGFRKDSPPNMIRKCFDLMIDLCRYLHTVVWWPKTMR